ncbi:cardiolipin synthase [Aliivibrio fischeri]|uniref:cardiolipin synthase n=1 Tax=Aliivibrio fischeri TaxID=668 RepID=UPI00080DDE09|nr:cardiolipin synthase [Aliivibrio fischeri]OCH02231.1 cardiolipin synthase [Aliivibrio fischeri]OCH58404.1 cardiolipin synthase [Aliivibrio fischeri]
MDKFYQALTIVSFVLYWLLVAGVTIRVVFKPRPVGVSLAWLMIIYILPVIGVMAYFLIGELNLGRTRGERARAMFTPYEQWFAQIHHCQYHQPHSISHRISAIHNLCSNRLGIPALSGDTLSLLNTPSEILNAIISDIEKAEHEINMEFYIWHHGGLADSVASALIGAAKRGVTVNVLLDSAGSMDFFKSHWPKLLKQSGVNIVEALSVSPFRMFFRRLDLRLHRKIVVIDNRIAYTGSMNLVDPQYFKQNSGVGQWIDVMVRLTGPNVAILNTIHAWDWEVEMGIRELPHLPECPASIDPFNHTTQVVPSGPGMPDDIIQQVLITAICQARKSITITTPYFVPSEILLHTLRTTAHRGVEVKLILPKKNDSLMVNWASKSFFETLLKAGVQIHEFNGGLLHTKSVVIDESHCIIGTVNLDMRSFWLNFEVSLIVDDPEFTKQLSWVLDGYLEQSTQVCFDTWRHRSWGNRFTERFFSMFSPLL